MANETPPPFVPFAPNFQPPAPQQPDLESNKPAKPPRKGRGRKKATVLRRDTADVVDTTGKHLGTATIETVAQKPQRKRRTGKRTLKYDLQTILDVASTLKESDREAFELLLGELSALAKGSRERVLKALGEVFG